MSGVAVSWTAAARSDGAGAEHARAYPARLIPLFRTTEPSKDDPDLLVAAIAGQPQLITNGVKINPIVEIEDVDEVEWDALRTAVRQSYLDSLQCLAASRDWTQVQIGMAIGLVAHTAYHLGAIRQIAKAAKQ